MIPLLVRTYCCIAVLLPYDYFVFYALNIQRIQHQVVFVRHTGRQQKPYLSFRHAAQILTRGERYTGRRSARVQV